MTVEKCPICESENIEENDPEPGMFSCRDCGEWLDESGEPI